MQKLARQLNVQTHTYWFFYKNTSGKEFEKRKPWVLISRNIPILENMSEQASCMGWDFQNHWLRFRFLSHAWTKYSSHSISICNDLTLQSFIISISNRTSKNTVLWIALPSQKSVAKSQLLKLWDRKNYLRSAIVCWVSWAAFSHLITFEIGKCSFKRIPTHIQSHLTSLLSQMTRRR